MRPLDRIRYEKYPYYSVASWSTKLQCFLSGKQTFDTEQGAKQSTKKPGRYKIVKTTKEGRVFLSEFEIK